MFNAWSKVFRKVKTRKSQEHSCNDIYFKNDVTQVKQPLKCGRGKAPPPQKQPNFSDVIYGSLSPILFFLVLNQGQHTQPHLVRHTCTHRLHPIHPNTFVQYDEQLDTKITSQRNTLLELLFKCCIWLLKWYWIITQS